MSYFDDMSRKELQRCLQYLDYKKQHGMNRQETEDEHQRTEIMKLILHGNRNQDTFLKQ